MKNRKLKRPNKALWRVGDILGRNFIRKLNLEVADNVTTCLDPPYIVIVNHGSIFDYRITCHVMKKVRPNHVAAYNQFARRYHLMRWLGVCPKRQFVPNVEVVNEIECVLDKKGVFVIFPEGAISLDGTSRDFPQSTAKLIKHLNVPVAVMNIKGTYLVKPRYDEVFHKTDKVSVQFDCLFTKAQISEMSIDEIWSKTKIALAQDVWEWQHENNVRVHEKQITRGLHNLLYKCAECGAEYAMETHDNIIRCNACGKAWTLSPLCRFSSIGGTKFDNIHEWFEWQRSEVKKEIGEDFCQTDDVLLYDLKNFNGYKKRGEGKLTQTTKGIKYSGSYSKKKFEIIFPAKRFYTIPCGNDFVECSNRENSFRFYFKNKSRAIKFVLAVEEIYKSKKGEIV